MLLVMTNPFGNKARDILESNYSKNDILYNDTGRKYSKLEVESLLKKYSPEIIIAGTEKYDGKNLDLCPNLKIISRVGIGLDSVDIEECSKRKIIVTYTPDAPSISVAELTISQCINALRRVQDISNNLKNKNWTRLIGGEIYNKRIGIIGYGRIGKLVRKRFLSFDPSHILVNDIITTDIENTPKEIIYNTCDIITLHIPLNSSTKNMITSRELGMMNNNVVLINTSRGGIINEKDLIEWLKDNKNCRAIVDTFENEPYEGELIKLDNAYITPHIGSCSDRSRFEMETGAVREVCRYINKQPFKNRVV